MGKTSPLRGLLSRNMIFKIMLLTLAWVILTESFSIYSLAAGIAISIISVYIFDRFLPLPKIDNFSPLRFTVYLFYLFGNVYVSAIKTIILIFKDADYDTVTLKTRISNRFLKTMLANSITLTPGTISLDLKDDAISILFLFDRSKGQELSREAVEKTKLSLERILIKAER